MGIKDKTREELEHDSIQSRITLISAKITANFEVMGIQLDNILKEAKITNGKIKELENDTQLFRLLRKNKFILILSIIGLWALFEIASVENITKLIKFIM